METMWGDFSAVLDRLRMLATLVSLVLALLQCYFGYRFLKFWVTVLGFLIGFVGALIGSTYLFEDLYWYVWIGAIAIGALFAFFAFKLYKVGVFLFSGLVFAIAAYALLSVFTLPPAVVAVVCVVCFVVGGILGVKFQRPLIIVITAISGAITSTRILAGIIPLLTENSGYALIIGMAIAGSGILLQFLMNPSDGKKRSGRKHT